MLDAGQTRLRLVVGELVAALTAGASVPGFGERLAVVADRLEPLQDERADAASLPAALQAAVTELASTEADGPTAAVRLAAVLEGAWPASSGVSEDQR